MKTAKRWSFLFFTLFTLTACNREGKIRIAYQSMPNPWKALIHKKQLESKTGRSIEWLSYPSGQSIIDAMKAGEVDTAVIGSTPLAAGLATGLNAKVIWVMETIGAAEALVAHPKIRDISQLRGKTIATPFGSTSHYHLLLALKSAGVLESDCKIIDVAEGAILPLWRSGQIDAAYVWAPVLEELKLSGNVLITSQDLANRGSPTFDAIVATNQVLEKNPKFFGKLLAEIDRLHTQVPNWRPNTKEVKAVADFLGTTAGQVHRALKGYRFPTRDEQLSDKLLGKGVTDALINTLDFVKRYEAIKEGVPSFEEVVDDSYARSVDQH